MIVIFLSLFQDPTTRSEIETLFAENNFAELEERLSTRTLMVTRGDTVSEQLTM